MTMTKALNFNKNFVVFAVTLWLFAGIGLAQEPLTEVEYRLTGLSLEVSPTELTVPRGTPTQVNATVVGQETLKDGASVTAKLRGPSFPDTLEIKTRPGQPIQIPPLSRPGVHFLEDIRLVVDETLSLTARPASVTINVLEELLVGEVTSRPLSLEEIEEQGIQFDENSFQAFEFAIAFTTASDVVEIEVPVLIPVSAGAEERRNIQFPGGLGTVRIPGLDIPNVHLEPIMLELIKDGGGSGENIPSIPGIIVIPGNIAFLNQFFSVLLLVTNEAPDGTPLIVENVRAEIMLPSGGDHVMGDITLDPPFQPGDPQFDNPLRLAKTAAGRENIKPVISPGPDTVPGTDDDVDHLIPQGEGTSEFLVEGIREGGHIVEIEIKGTLIGLPSGPVEVMGIARGPVVVRDPNFSLTFIHPDIVRAGETYDLVAQIQNTSLVAANLVTISLDPPNLSGARLLNPEDTTQIVDTIPAGDSATIVFTLEALRTGQVNASTLEVVGASGIVDGRRLSLRAGISEDGVPLSSDTLILPPAVGLLRERSGNEDLTFRAVALLGQAHSTATAPPGTLPLAVQRISAETVTQRAQELSEAAFRLELSVQADPNGMPVPLPEGLLLTLQDLYFDFLGVGVPDAAWDSLYRRSRQARLFGVALADVLRQEIDSLGFSDLLELQRSWADTESYRPGHLTIMTQTSGDSIPVILELADGFGRTLGGSLDPEAGNFDIPNADILSFSRNNQVDGQFAIVTDLTVSPYTATFTVIQDGAFDLGIVVPDIDGELQQFVFRDLAITNGDQLTATVTPGEDPLVVLRRDTVIIAESSITAIPDQPPKVLGILQNADDDVDQFGRVVAVLFSEDVDKSTAQASNSYSLNEAIIPMIPPPELADSNIVGNALVQFGDRIVLLGLRDPIGPFVRRSLNVQNIRDNRGQVMDPVENFTILPDPDIGLGGQITGRILRSDGSPIPEAEVSYFQFEEGVFKCREKILSIKHADRTVNMDWISS